MTSKKLIRGICIFSCLTITTVVEQPLVAQPKLLHTMYGGSEAFIDLAFDPTNKFLMTVGGDGTRGQAFLKWWDLSTGRLVKTKTLSIHIPSSKHPAVFLGPNFLVVNGPPFVVYDIINEKHLFKTEIPVTAPVISDDESTAAWFSVDEKELERRNRIRGRRQNRPEQPLKPVLYVLDLRTAKISKSKKLEIDRVRDAAISNDGRLLVSRSWPDSKKRADEHVLTIWDTDKCIELAKLKDKIRTHRADVFENIKNLWFSPAGKQIFTTREFKLWDVKAKSVAELPYGYAFCFDTTWSKLIYQSFDGSILVRDMVAKKVNGRCDCSDLNPVQRLILTEDGNTLVGYFDRTKQPQPGQPSFRAWNVATGKMVANLPGDWDMTINSKISPDGKFAVSSHGKIEKDNWVGQLNIWQIAN